MFSTTARYSWASSVARADQLLGSGLGVTSAHSWPPTSAVTSPSTARTRPWTATTSVPSGRFPFSSILAITPTVAYLPSTLGSSRSRPSSLSAADTAVRASSESVGIVALIWGRTTAWVRGRTGSFRVLSGICFVAISLTGLSFHEPHLLFTRARVAGNRARARVGLTYWR